MLQGNNPILFPTQKNNIARTCCTFREHTQMQPGYLTCAGDKEVIQAVWNRIYGGGYINTVELYKAFLYFNQILDSSYTPTKITQGNTKRLLSHGQLHPLASFRKHYLGALAVFIENKFSKIYQLCWLTDGIRITSMFFWCL